VLNREEAVGGKKDIRDTALFREAEALSKAFRQPGSGLLSDAAEIHVGPDARRAVFAGSLMDALEGLAPTRVCLIDLDSAQMRVLTFGPNSDRLPKFSPDGKHVAFLSDRVKAGDFQLFLLDPDTGAARPATLVEGWVEYFHWSPNGQRIVLGVAGHGADISGGQGAITSKQELQPLPSWMPSVETGDETFRWRSVWVWDFASGRVTRVPCDVNVWEAVWCGNESLAAVVSAGPGEGLWYSAWLARIDIKSGGSLDVYIPREQLGWPAVSPSGNTVVIAEAVCSDRWIVAGELRLIDIASGKRETVDTHGIDVSYAEWRSEHMLLLAGHRGFDTVVCLYDTKSRTFRETWSSRDVTTAGRFVTVAGVGGQGDCALVGEGFTRAPEIAVIRRGQYTCIKSLSLDASDADIIRSIDRVTWKASDGLEILGYVLRTEDSGPGPLVMEVHGGPVWHWRPRWLGRGSMHILMLIKRGYAIFLPNPRGSAGRGQDFARRVKGDINGVDTYDYLSGLDQLVARKVADPKRLGVMGGSYGGNMTSWLITQDKRFAAAIPVAPHTNQVTEHLISNIPHFVELFLGDKYNNPGGKYFQRSAVMHAHKTKTPTLNITGALDRCTPPEEAMQFHNALLQNGVESVLTVYPEEGHGIRKYPAILDYAARIVSWFESHLVSDD
jgi:dipeptidyl aminopeptidase/acylaminoacyl peptidase